MLSIICLKVRLDWCNRYLKASPTNTLNAMMKSLVDRFGVLILPGDNFPLHIQTPQTSSQPPAAEEEGLFISL